MRKKLGAGDAFFLHIESPNTHMHIGVLCRFKLPKGKDKRFVLDLVKAFREYTPDKPPFNFVLAKKALKVSAPEWETTDDIDIDYHLRHSALPQPGTERELAVLVSRLHSIPLDRSRPMWECHIIEGLEDDSFAIYGKMHHALVDGVAGARMMERWLTEFGEGKELLPYWAMPEAKRKPRDKKRADRSKPFARLMQQISKPAKSVPAVLSAVTETIKGQASKKLPGLVAPYSAPETVLNLPVGPQRRVSIADFELARFQNLAKQLKGTLNDVVMAVAGDALRRYLIELDALPQTPLIAQVPVSFRAADDVGGGNAIGMILASLATELEDPLERFKATQKSMTSAKTMMKGLSTSQITAYSSLMVLPYAIGQVTGIGNRRRRPMYNVVISNVPGPKKQLSLHGAEMTSVHPVSLIMQGQALNLTLFSYGEQFSFIYTACRRSLPHVQHLVGHTEDALAALEQAAGIKAGKKAA